MTEGAENNDCLADTEPADLTLVVEDVDIPCHRRQLCEASEYFSAMFRSNMRESSATRVEIHGVPAWVLQVLIKYSYRTERLTLSMKNVYDILSGASMLQFPSVIKQCATFMSDNISLSNCLNMMFFSDSNGLESEYFKAKRLAFWHFTEVSNLEEYCQLPLSAVVDYLSSDLLNVVSELSVFEAICNWVVYNKAGRIAELPELLRQVRFGCLTVEEMDAVVDNELVAGTTKCVDYLRQVQEDLASSSRDTDRLPRVSTLYYSCVSLMGFYLNLLTFAVW